MAYGRPDINEILRYFQEKLGDVPMDGTVVFNRNNAKRLLDWGKKTYPGVDPVATIKRLIDIGTADDFHKQFCNTFLYIDRHKGKLIMLGREQRAKEKPKVQEGPYRIVKKI